MLEYLIFLLKKLKKKIPLVLVLSLLLSVFYFFKTKHYPTTYKSYSKIFPLIKDEGSDPLSSIKGRLGMAGSNFNSTYYNVVELLNSRTISRKIVTYPTENINYQKLCEWLIKDADKRIPFWQSPVGVSNDSFKNIVYAANLLRANSQIRIEKSEFIVIECTATSDTLALIMNKNIIRALSDFYIASKTEKSRLDISNLRLMVDSLKSAMNKIELAKTGNLDEIRYLVDNKATITQLKLERMYEEVAKQYMVSSEAYQNAKFRLLYESPIFQTLDEPDRPVTSITPKIKLNTFIVFLIVFLLISLLFISKDLFRILKNEFNKAIISATSSTSTPPSN